MSVQAVRGGCHGSKNRCGRPLSSDRLQGPVVMSREASPLVRRGGACLRTPRGEKQMSTQLVESVKSLTRVSRARRSAEETLVRLLATGGLVEEWSLLSAASLLLERTVHGAEIDSLVTAGRVVRRRTCLALSDYSAVTG